MIAAKVLTPNANRFVSI